MKKEVCIQHYSSPCGELIIASTNDALCLCDWNGMPCAERSRRRLEHYLNADFKIQSSAVLEEAKRQLEEYFVGNRRVFEIPLQLVGTNFQLRVWQALLDIPYGTTKSYMDIAKAMGTEKGVRAVAQAIGANGIDIFVPCHRVIGSNHSLTGYAGGLEKKEFLLKHEKHVFREKMW